MATIVPLVPTQEHSTNLYSSRSITSLHQSSCQRDPLCVLRVVVLLHFIKSFLPFLAVLFTLAFVLPVTGMPLVVVRARPPTRFGCFACIQFSFDNSRHVTLSSTP